MSYTPTPNTTSTPSFTTSNPTPTEAHASPASHSTHGTGGQHAAENTKGAFAGVGEATESVRQNINSYADTLITGHSKVDSDNEYHTTEVKEHGGTGIHPDAKRAGDEAARAAGKVAGKVEDMVGGHKGGSSGTAGR